MLPNEHSDEIQLPELRSNIVILRDEETGEPTELIFHVKNGDFFAMLATLLGFVEETAEKLKEKDEAMSIAEAQIALLRKNLIYLQEHYCIEPKTKASVV